MLEDVNGKQVPTDGNLLLQKAFMKTLDPGSPEMRDTKLCTAGKGWLHRYWNRFSLLASHIITARRVSKIF